MKWAMLGWMMLLAGLPMVARADQVPGRAEEVTPLAVGAEVPNVTLQTAEGKPVLLLEAVKQQRSVIIFYRGGWCPYCNSHLSRIQSVEPRLRELGYQILAISADRPEKLKATREKQELNYRLLSDATMAGARSFGIAFRVDDATVKTYRGFGVDLEEASGNTHHILPVPAVFLADQEGRIVYAHANPDYKHRLAPEILVKEAEAALK